MRKRILAMQVSVDGFIEGPDGNIRYNDGSRMAEYRNIGWKTQQQLCCRP